MPLVTDGQIGSLTKMLSDKIGSPVKVFRDDQYLVGSRRTTRYSINMPDCRPALFTGMAVGECKSRLAMLYDMLASGVIRGKA